MTEKEKQIEKMAREFSGDCNEIECKSCAIIIYCKAHRLATNIYNAGYRKQSELVGEIFAEIEPVFMSFCSSLEAYTAWQNLKNKYTEGEK